MTLSVGFRITVSLLILLPSYGAPTLTPVGLTPTERASLCWTHTVCFVASEITYRGGELGSNRNALPRD